MKSSKRPFLICSVLLTALVLSAGASFACTYQCVKVADPFCRRCLDTGSYTGITCQDSGNCGCFFTQNTCGMLASGIQAQPDLAMVIGAAEQGAVCSSQDTGSVLPDALLQ